MGIKDTLNKRHINESVNDIVSTADKQVNDQ